MRLLSHLLRRFIRTGHLRITDHAGAVQSFGAPGTTPAVALRFTDKAVEREIFFNPELKTAEAYMDGRLQMQDGSAIFDLLHLFSVNRTGLAAHPVQQALRRVWRALRRRQQRNPLGLAAQNIRHHYDIPPDFYRLWLDPTMTYSCAYYTAPDVGLHQAQIDKLRHIAAKLRLEPGMEVAEIGSGWGRSPPSWPATTACASPPSPSRQSRSRLQSSAPKMKASPISSPSSSRTTGRWKAPTTASSPSP